MDGRKGGLDPERGGAHEHGGYRHRRREYSRDPVLNRKILSRKTEGVRKIGGLPFFLAEGNRPLVSGFLISASFKGSLKDCS